MSDHYAVLGLAPDATLPAIRQAFRQKASLHHPDKNDAADAAERFRAAQQAYEVLSDPVQRQAIIDQIAPELTDAIKKGDGGNGEVTEPDVMVKVSVAQ